MGASSFNGDLSKWDVSSVTTMLGMFYRASSFAQTLCGAWRTSTAVKIHMFIFSRGRLCLSTSTRSTTTSMTTNTPTTTTSTTTSTDGSTTTSTTTNTPTSTTSTTASSTAALTATIATSRTPTTIMTTMATMMSGRPIDNVYAEDKPSPS